MSLGTFDPGPFRHWPAIDFPQDNLFLRITQFPPGAPIEKWSVSFLVEDAEGSEVPESEITDEQINRIWVDDENGKILDLRLIPTIIDGGFSQCDGTNADFFYDINGNQMSAGSRPFDGYQIQRAAVMNVLRSAINLTEREDPEDPLSACILISEEPTADPGYTNGGTMSPA